MTRPDYVSEELWERAHELSVDILFADTKEDEMRAFAIALLQARNDALREAAKVAGPNYGDGAFNAYENGRRDAANTILSLIQEPS